MATKSADCKKASKMSGDFYVSGSSFVCIFRISDNCFLNVRDSLFGDNKKYIQFKYKDYVFHLSAASFDVFLSAIKNSDVKKAHLNTTTWIEKLDEGVMIKRFGAKTILTYDEIEEIKKESSDILAVIKDKLPLYKMASKSLYNQQNDEDDVDLIMSEPSDLEDNDNDICDDDIIDANEINDVINKTDGYNELDTSHELSDIMMPKTENETIDLTADSETEDEEDNVDLSDIHRNEESSTIRNEEIDRGGENDNQNLATNNCNDSQNENGDHGDTGRMFTDKFIYRSSFQHNLPQQIDPPQARHQIVNHSNVKLQNARRKSDGAIAIENSEIPQKMSKIAQNNTPTRQLSRSTPLISTRGNDDIPTSSHRRANDIPDVTGNDNSTDSTRLIIDENM